MSVKQLPCIGTVLLGTMYVSGQCGLTVFPGSRLPRKAGTYFPGLQYQTKITGVCISSSWMSWSGWSWTLAPEGGAGIRPALSSLGAHLVRHEPELLICTKVQVQ